MTKRVLSLRLSLALLAFVVAPGCRDAVAANQCLSKAEVLDVAQMASVMAIGAALQRCGSCLGPRYQQALDHYEANHLLEDFRIAEAAIRDKAKFDLADDLVRQAARDYADDLSGDCQACLKAADTIDALSTPEARSRLYGRQADRLSKRPELKGCQ